MDVKISLEDLASRHPSVIIKDSDSPYIFKQIAAGIFRSCREVRGVLIPTHLDIETDIWTDRPLGNCSQKDVETWLESANLSGFFSPRADEGAEAWIPVVVNSRCLSFLEPFIGKEAFLTYLNSD